MTDNRWITSDLHFGHKKILEFCSDSRPFKTVEEMDEALIERWNEKVKPEDIVYHLGDFSWYSQQKNLEIIKRLNGHKHFILGNHDHGLHSLRRNVDWMGHYKTIKFDGRYVVLFHYPILYWDKQHYNSFHLHGHLHSNSEGLPLDSVFTHTNPALVNMRCKDVGADSNNLYPYNLKEVLDMLDAKASEHGDLRPGRSKV